MNPTHLWPLVPALAVVLLHLDTFADDAARLCAFVIERLGKVGAMWR